MSMVSKQSPIVYGKTYQANRTYPRYQSASRFEHTDVFLILIFCLAMYGLFLYYFLPSFAPGSYRRIVAELGYHWQIAWQATEYSLAQVSLSLSHTPVLGEWYQYLTTR